MRRIGKPIDNVVVMPVGLDDGAGGGAKAGPDIGQQSILAQELRALTAADPASDANTIHGPQQRRAFSQRLWLIDRQYRIVPGEHKWTQVMQA